MHPLLRTDENHIYFFFWVSNFSVIIRGKYLLFKHIGSYHSVVCWSVGSFNGNVKNEHLQKEENSGKGKNFGQAQSEGITTRVAGEFLGGDPGLFLDFSCEREGDLMISQFCALPG